MDPALCAAVHFADFSKKNLLKSKHKRAQMFYHCALFVKHLRWHYVKKNDRQKTPKN